MNNIYNYILDDVIEKDVSFKYKLKSLKEEIILYDKKHINNDNNALIIGYSNLEKYKNSYKEDEDKNILSFCINSKETYYLVNKNKKNLTKLIGFVKVEENKYIGVYEYPVFLFILLFLLILLFIFLLSKPTSIKSSNNSTHDSGKKELAETVKSDGNVTNDDLFIPDTGSIEFAGYDLVYTAEGSKVILLENPAINDVYFTYTITNNADGSILLDETGLIQPGTAYEWDAYGVLPVGEYSITMRILTYDMENTDITYTPAIMDNVTLKIY